jgi:hypothetical protein
MTALRVFISSNPLFHGSARDKALRAALAPHAIAFELRGSNARDTFDLIAGCDIFVWFASTSDVSSYIELGHAMSARFAWGPPRCILSVGLEQSSDYDGLVDYHCVNDHELLARLIGLAEGSR